MATVLAIHIYTVVAFGGLELIRLRHEKMKECKTFHFNYHTQICLFIGENLQNRRSLRIGKNCASVRTHARYTHATYARTTFFTLVSQFVLSLTFSLQFACFILFKQLTN